MSASRRGLLGGGATALLLGAGVAGAKAAERASPDAALIQTCSRYLELEQAINDPSHPDAHKDADEMAEWPEYEAARLVIEAATPQTVAGVAALARVAIQSSEGYADDWDGCTPHRIAYGLLLRLAGEVA